MDERHWWFASKLQESFHFGGYDNPTLLEDFLSEPEVVELINDFLAPGEPHKLFFYCDEIPNGDSRAPSVSSRQLHITSKLSKDVVSQGRVCLYVLRTDVGGEVDVTQMEKELFCGELRHSVLSSLASLLAEVYAPLLHSQKQWGECNRDSTSVFLQHFLKFSNALLEMSSMAQIHQPMLQRPGLDVRSEVLYQQGKGGFLGDIVIECEALVADWISTIESLLIETTDERLEDPYGSLPSELNKWQRRQTLLLSVVEQLKTKECKTLIAALVATKSRLLKKWKGIDIQLTDAFNNARDRVHYLETLSPHLEALHSSLPPPSPSTVTTTILPALGAAMRQMEGLSRAYARSGYLGILFTKISNTLVQVCMTNIEVYASGEGGEDRFWSLVSEAILSEAKEPSKDHPLITQLNSCLQLTTAYKELLYQLKDGLFQQQVSFSVSTVGIVSSHTSCISKKASGIPSSSTPKKASHKHSGHGGHPMNTDDSASIIPQTASGIPLHNVDKITSGMNDFGLRVSRVLEIVSTLARFRELQGHMGGLPRIAGLWDLEEEVIPEGGSEGRSSSLPEEPGGSGVKLVTRGPLSTLREESLMSSSNSEGERTREREQTAREEEDTNSEAVPRSSSQFRAPSSDSASVGQMVEQNLKRIEGKLESSCGGGVPDVFSITGKSKSVFPAAYEEYSSQIASLEENICLYLTVVFPDVMTSKTALKIISRFVAVSSRYAVKEALQKCTLAAFNRYARELEEIQTTYEMNKGSPPLSRNAPPVAGAVSWSRELLRRVEEPMEVFRNENTVMQSMESMHVCKLYNRLATALLKYETLWLSQWKASIEQGAGLKATLLVQEGTHVTEGAVIRVNCHKSLLELIAESRSLIQLGITIPETAMATLKQESRIKHFKQHLEHVVGEFNMVLGAIDPAVRPLMAPHIETVVRSLLPGWTTLTWSTMNIDAFLHRVQTAVTSLKTMAGKIGEILCERVYGALERGIGRASLYDVQLAASRVWHPREFCDIIRSSIAERSTKLLEDIASIRTAVIEIITLASGKSLAVIHTPTREETSQRSKGSTPQHRPHSRPTLGILSPRDTSSGTTHTTTQTYYINAPLLTETEENVLDHFCELVFGVVGKMVLRSHSELSSSLVSAQHTKEEAVDAGHKMSDHKGRGILKNLEAAANGCGLDTTIDRKIVSFHDPVSEEMTTPQPDSQTTSQSHSKPLRLMVNVQFSIPRIHLEPSLQAVHTHLSQVSSAMVGVLHHVTQWRGGVSGSRALYDVFERNGTVQSLQENMLLAVQSLEPGVDECLSSLRLYDFLWQEDLHASYQRFLDEGAQERECRFQVEGFMEIEKKVSEVPPTFTVGPLHLTTEPIKNSLKALTVAWKTEFASFLHSKAKASLDSLVSQRELMSSQLSTPVHTLHHLKETLELLQHITDLQNVMDELYLPVERLYGLLREYNPHLPRGEVQQVDSLREEWRSLTELAEKVQQCLLSEQRLSHDREVDKQVKAFVVETIQFRNSFDTEGPLVPGLTPSEAGSRLVSFLEHCEELKKQRDLLGAVQRLLNIPPTPYPELDRTEQDLSYLRALYSNYQQFIAFDKRLRQELWSAVDLDAAIQEVGGFWGAYQSLPVEQQEWDASRKLRSEICQYTEVLPLLKRLHSKEIRNRHWLQVMGVVNCTFQLEGSVFKMAHLLDAGLLLHAVAIHEIVRCAKCELELEEMFYNIEEEWSEQALHFLSYKSLGPILLTEDHTLSLLEQLEHAQMQLATMLMSPHILPLKEEATQWAVKLASVGEVLQQWLSVQELWRNLEAVFSNPTTAREFPGESVRFAATHSSWVKVMKRAHWTKNVLQCCLGGEVPKVVVLSKIAQELEGCKKSLSSYLLSKRQAFPRFYYVSDDTLLTILSNSTAVQPHLRSLFSAMGAIITTAPEEEGDAPVICAVESSEGEKLQLANPVHLGLSVEEWISQLLSSIQSTLRRFLMLSTIEGALSLEECAHQNVTQVACMALYCHWTKDSELALTQCRYDRRAISSARAKFNMLAVGKLSSLLMRNSWKVADEPLTPVDRTKLESMAMLSLWLRDILEDLCHRKLKDMTDFEWQRFPRPYMEPSSGDHTHQLVLRCLDTQLSYGWEYLGCQAPPVFTPRTDNYIIAFTQTISSHLGSLLTGPTGSGKMQLIKGVGLLCGRFVLTLHCSALTNKTAIARAFEGLAQDGSWVCFTDVQTLQPSVFSVLSQMMYTITTALCSKMAVCQLPQGRQIPLISDLAVFLTSSDKWQMPPTLSPLFRSFSLPLPDPTIVFRAHCTALGLRAPKALTNKLVTLHNMAREQLSFTSPQACLSLSSICHVLKVASQRLGRPKGLATRQTPEHGVGQMSSTELQTTHTLTSRCSVHETRPRKTTSFITNPSTGQPLPPAAHREHSTIAHLILTIIGPRFADQELPVFVSLVRDVFASSLPDMSSTQLLAADLSSLPLNTSVANTTQDLTSMAGLLKKQSRKAGLDPSEAWMGKVEQLLTLTSLNHAVLIAGTPATGKSTALSTVVSTLNSALGESSSVKLLRLYPGAFEDPSVLFGQVSPTGDWMDGVFTSIFRKAHKATHTVTWVCFDGTLQSSWVHYLSELIGKSKTMTLPNGEHLFMNDSNLKLVFETGTLSNASPTTLTNCGVVYFDSSVLGWRPVVTAWLVTRRPHEGQCLQRHFDTIMDPVVEFVLQKSSHGSAYSEVGLLETCLAYLTTLLNIYAETAEVFSEVHVERLLLFSVIWSYGGVLLRERDQKRFSQLLKTLTNSLPDDDSEYSVFDYYVDESGEWDVWQSKVPEQPNPQVDLFGRVFVDTPDSVRVEVLLELALSSRRHVLMVGTHGCGKTVTCKHFLHSRALNSTKTETVRQVVFNGHTSASSIHHFMQINFHHRQGYTCGPKHGKTLELFIDDLHLPLRHSTADSCTPHEYLRQVLDSRGLYNLQKQNDWCSIEDLVVFGALTSARRRTTVAPRLQRHFAVIQIPNVTENSLKTITSQLLQALFVAPTSTSASLEGVHSASVELHSMVRQALKVSDMPGRQHYFFSLGNLESVFQGLSHCPDVSELAFNWSHETKRAFVNGLCRLTDTEWMSGYVDTLARKYLSLPDDGKLPIALSAIPTETRQGEEQPTSTVSPLNVLPEVTLHPLSQWSDLQLSISHYLRRYKEEIGPLHLELSNNNSLNYLVKLHRALKFPRGNCILVGSLGQPLEPLASFALYIAGYSLQSLDSSKPTAFSDGLRALFRQAGLEGKPVGIIITEKDLQDLEVLKTINSIMACGELPTLFSNDEMEGLLQALVPAIKRDFPSEETDPMQYFTARIYRNLRIVLCLTPTCTVLNSQAHDFKGLLQSCHLIWMCDWTRESLANTVDHFFSESPLATTDIDEELKSPLYNCLLTIHHHMMKETGQLQHTGLQPNHFIDVTTSKLPPSSQKPASEAQAAAPSSFKCLLEKVHRELDGGRRGGLALSYVGPRTFLQFLECFCEIFRRKNSESVAEEENLRKALETLQNTQHEANVIRDTLNELKQKHEKASKVSQTLLGELTAKACQLERLKALLGHGSSVLSAMQMVGEQERQMTENEEDDEELLSVFLDGLGRRSSRLEKLLGRAREQLEAAEEEEKEARKTMIKAKEQGHYWQEKIDRNTIDQIKFLNNPPKLVGTIMELILTLLQQYGTGTGTEQPGMGYKSEDSSASTPGHNAPPALKKRISMATISSETTRMEREQWLAIQQAIGDSQNFLELLNGLKWQDGLKTKAVHLIESKLATSHNTSVSKVVSTPSTGDRKPLITVSMAKHAAECAATMCAFAVAIVEHHHSFQPYRLAVEKLKRARQEQHDVESSVELGDDLKPGDSHFPRSGPPDLAEVEEEAELGEEDVERLQSEVRELQASFDRAVMEKYSLGQTCQQLAEKLKSANHLLESLKVRQDSWQRQLEAIPPLKTLMANCILAAALTVYCGPLDTSARYTVFDSLLAMTRHCGVISGNEDQKSLLSLSSYAAFMLGEPTLYHLVMEELPQDLTSQQNATIISHSHTRTWPLIVDRLGMVEQWLRNREKDTVFIEHKNGELHGVILECMSKGTSLVIVGVDTECLSEDKPLMDVLQCRRVLHRAKTMQKIMVGDKEVECSPGFRLYTVTSAPVCGVPSDVTSLMSVVDFHPERGGLGELLLDRFLWLQNPKTSQERQQLRQEIHKQAVRLQSEEGEMLQLLAQERQLEDPKTIKSILMLNSSYEDAQYSLAKALGSYSMINEVHLATLRYLATQASVMMEVVFATGSSLLPVYQTSYSYVESVFLSFVEQAGSRIQGEDALHKMTQAAYTHFLRGYFEKDRLLFSLTLALEIECSRGRASQSEREFLTCPSPGRQFSIRGLTTQVPSETGGSPMLNFGKKPFDWLTDVQWQMLLMLASHFRWIHEILERLGKDGKETVWRTVGEGVAPETIDFAEGIGCKLFPLQQLLIMQAMRPERLTQCIVSFITAVLEHRQRKLRYGAPIDLHKVARSCKPDQFPLILYKEDPHIPVAKVQQLARKAQVPLTICYLHGTGKDEVDTVRQSLELASSQGQWLLLHNIHTNPELLSQLPSLLEQCPNRDSWRIWLTAFGESCLPTTILQSSCKVVLDSPKSVQSSVLHSFSWMGGEVFSTSSRPEWLPLLHNIAMFHATVRLRGQTYSHAWTEDYCWTHTQLMDTLGYVVREFELCEMAQPGVRTLSWSGVRHMITEVLYGSYITNPTDAAVFSALAEHWVHPGGPKREAGRYHISLQFFVPNTRFCPLVQAVENASPPLVFTAELCGLYYSPVIRLGWNDYLFSKLSLLSAQIKQHSHLTLRKHDFPPPSRLKSIVSDTSSQNMVTQSSKTLPPPTDKLPSFIQVPSQISEINLTAVSCFGLQMLISEDASLLKDLPLLGTVDKLMENVPTGWKKEVLLERLRKHGMDTPFGLFLKSETTRMAECLQGIHSSLQELRTALTDTSRGDTLHEFPHLIDLALSLLTLRVPHHWLLVVGSSAPPATWPLKEWVQDLVLRFTFIDRVLATGITKTPTYWLGAFFNPQGFLSVVQQYVVKSLCVKSGAVEQFSFQAELTNRDKDHIRDPPPEGELFIYGVYLWGCGFEKTATLELQDVPPKSQVPASLPLLHLRLSTQTEPPATQQVADSKGPAVFHCPCFTSNYTRAQNRALFTMAISSNDITPAKWAMRNLALTLRPF